MIPVPGDSRRPRAKITSTAGHDAAVAVGTVLGSAEGAINIASATTIVAAALVAVARIRIIQSLSAVNWAA